MIHSWRLIFAPISRTRARAFAARRVARLSRRSSPTFAAVRLAAPPGDGGEKLLLRHVRHHPRGVPRAVGPRGGVDPAVLRQTRGRAHAATRARARRRRAPSAVSQGRDARHALRRGQRQPRHTSSRSSAPARGAAIGTPSANEGAGGVYRIGGRRGLPGAASGVGRGVVPEHVVARTECYRLLGEKLVECPPRSDVRLAILREVWAAVRTCADLHAYLRCATRGASTSSRTSGARNSTRSFGTR